MVSGWSKMTTHVIFFKKGFLYGVGFTLCHWTETLLHRSLSDHERATYLSDYSGPINFSQVFQTVLSKDHLFKYHKYLSKPLELSFYISRISLRVHRIIFLESIKFIIKISIFRFFVPINSYQ